MEEKKIKLISNSIVSSLDFMKGIHFTDWVEHSSALGLDYLANYLSSKSKIVAVEDTKYIEIGSDEFYENNLVADIYTGSECACFYLDSDIIQKSVSLDILKHGQLFLFATSAADCGSRLVEKISDAGGRDTVRKYLRNTTMDCRVKDARKAFKDELGLPGNLIERLHIMPVDEKDFRVYKQ